MASEASWQTGAAGRSAGARYPDAPLDQRGVESLLLKLVERVAESERRYGDALDDLHRRLDRLSQTAGAVRAGAPDDAETLERLHNQINRLGRRLDQESAAPLDDFERLGRTLSEGMATAARSAAYHEERDLDKRLVETAQRLERSIGNAMPAAAIEALNTRLDDIGSQLSQALRQVPQRENLQQVERQLSEMGRQLVRAERQLAKVGVIESQLLKLIERFDAKAARPEPAPLDLAQLKEIAQKAAADAARRVVKEEAPGTTGRLDAMQRDIAAMGDKNTHINEQLASKLQAVQDSLRRLAEQVESGTSSQPVKPRSAFVERSHATDEQPAPLSPQLATRQPKSSVETCSVKGDANGGTIVTPKDKPADPAPAFGRAKRSQSEEQSADLDATEIPTLDSVAETPEDPMTAARRGTRAATPRGDQTANDTIGRQTSDIERGPHRKRTLLIVAAAILLTLSAAVLLYERLRLKAESETVPPAVEQTVPAPAASAPETPAPRVKEETSPQSESGAAILELERPDSWAPLPAEKSPADKVPSRVGDASGVTDIAKSTQLVSTEPGEPSLDPQFAALKPNMVALPGVTFTVDGASLGDQAMDAAKAMPTTLPLPPETLGPLALRQAAAAGDAKAQYSIALRYAQGKGTARDMSEARRWLERAASAGFAPAQYRLGILYERGQGVDKDLGRARSWYAAAAEKGNVKAMHNLAIGASGGEDDLADYAEAARWHEAAAAYGFTDSQFNLGILYEHGLGRPRDLAEAYKWFALAALSGDAESAKQRDRLEAELNVGALTQAVQAVKTWQAKEMDAEANEASGNAEWNAPSPAPNAELVIRAQALLNQLGYDTGAPDGVMGLRTRAAIKSFERRQGLEETGEVSVPLVTTLERLTG
ncbi:MAG: peptidoglycan-binding protein [Methyloceanibacter sp.]|uniref:peptidoglycan-binding protein n=1 Tax=Methyloceanibacter sp. TaxID=1965321 RepID=UPI003D9BE06D